MPFIFNKDITKNLLKKKLIILGGVLFVALFIFIYVGFWPVASVNGDLVLAKEFNANYSLASKIYENNLKMLDKEIPAVKSKEVADLLKKAAINRIIEDELISEEIEKRISQDDLSLKIKEKIELEGLDKAEVKKGIEIAYALDMGEFKKLVLIPEAKREILEGNMFMKNEKYVDWYKEKYSQAQVSIFIPGLAWENGSVIMK